MAEAMGFLRLFRNCIFRLSLLIFDIVTLR
jgi:hypothetical protein